MTAKLTLVSHLLCPYVQRVAIVLAEQGVSFERVNIDLANKPDWFKAISPLEKTPVLLVDDAPIFESSVICEYLDEVHTSHLHPQSAIKKAQHRGQMEFARNILNLIGSFYSAPDQQILLSKAGEIRARFIQIESALGVGPYFAGEKFSMVDAAFGPVFRYFDLFDQIGYFGVFDDLPKVQAWRLALADRPSVKQAVQSDYLQLLKTFLLARDTALAVRIRTGERDYQTVKRRYQ